MPSTLQAVVLLPRGSVMPAYRLTERSARLLATSMSEQLKRKTIIVSVYYYGDKEPVTSLDTDEDWDKPDALFLNDTIKVALKHYNPDSDVFDVCIDETKPAIFSLGRWWSRYLYRLLRR
jgi:hypothetical protein